MDVVETIKYKGYEVNIHPDHDPMNPIKEFDLLGTMACSHSRYTLGHKQYDHGADMVYYTLKALGFKSRKMENDFDHDLSTYNFMNEYIGKIERYAIILPLYLYDHSGITINTTGFSCQWDSGQVGFIYVSFKKARKEYDWKVLNKERKNQIIEVLKNEVKLYDDYLTGNIYGYTVEDSITGNHISSCWGFYGDDWNPMKEHYGPDIDHWIDTLEKEKEKQTRQEIGDISQLNS